MILKKIFLFVFISIPLLFASDYNPFQKEAYLTSSFGESRGSRYHAGIDYSTNMEEGWTIFAPENGDIEDIKISPFGYGKVIYFKGESGKTWIFAHLQSFQKEIEELVQKRQKHERKNDVSIALPSLPSFKKGDTLAFSGSTGIGNPHLHLELRLDRNSLISPCQNGVKCFDTIPPTILEAAAWRKNKIHFTDQDNLDKGCLEVPNEDAPLRLAFKIVDYSRTPLENPMSVYRIELKAGNHSLFKRTQDTLAYTKMLHIRNELLWSEKTNERGDWHLILGSIPEERLLRLEVEDFSNNVSFKEFHIKNSCEQKWTPTLFQNQDSILFSSLSRAFLNLSLCPQKGFKLKDSQNKTIASNLCQLYPKKETPISIFFEKFPDAAKILVTNSSHAVEREILLFPLKNKKSFKAKLEDPYYFDFEIKGLKNPYIESILAIQKVKKDSLESIEFHPKGLQFTQNLKVCFEKKHTPNPIYWLGETSQKWFLFHNQKSDRNKTCIQVNELRDLSSILDTIPPKPGVPYFKEEQLRIPILEGPAGILNGNSIKVTSTKNEWIISEYDSDPQELVIKKEAIPLNDTLKVFMEDALGNSDSYFILKPKN